jgi:hypothetical protein
VKEKGEKTEDKKKIEADRVNKCISGLRPKTERYCISLDRLVGLITTSYISREICPKISGKDNLST